MDLNKAIRSLQAEKRRLEEAIASLEELLASKNRTESVDLDGLAKKGRGRTGMPPDERRAVSQRMKKYWAQQRAVKVKTAGKG